MVILFQILYNLELTIENFDHRTTLGVALTIAFRGARSRA